MINSHPAEDYSRESAQAKNSVEYDGQAELYFNWQQDHICMQKLHYYTTINELKKEGIEGKTFLEIGCGHCPIGQKLVELGAKKIIGLDISEGMLNEARQALTKKGIMDKFELINANICDEENFTLPEKVDVIVLCYVITTFVTTQDLLNTILSQSKKYLKEGGTVLITDVAFCPEQNLDEFDTLVQWNSLPEGVNTIEDFGVYRFHITTDPKIGCMNLFQMTPVNMFKAGYEAGFKNIQNIPQYPDPEYSEHPTIVRMLSYCTDYTMKFKL